ncbi:unnamed protein product [Allacma fusca]|uniref:MSP domain-containing protein n=1 Tax=Allacma fusca TaxID=39272 RepID=A0A8J2LA21_9HEXA|nr:unnamed protein product [Allacma fusca]
MPEQILRIDPEHELKFKGPFTTPTTSMLKLTNPSDKRICFKIKTTAPKRYCVRPNSGLLEPGASLGIAVVFQPCELEPTANKHKFMVQAIFAPDGEINMDQLWKDVDSSKLMDTKLRCSFELPVDAASQNDLNAVQEEIRKVVTREKHEEVSKPQKAYVDEGRVTDGSARMSPEVVQLKQLNSQLKDKIDELTRQLKSQNSGGNMVAMGNASPPTYPMLFIVFAIAAALVGLVLGKFVL